MEVHLPALRRPRTYGSLPLDPSLADLALAIGSDKSMWKVRRNEIVGGLEDLGRAIGKPMELIPAAPGLMSCCTPNASHPRSAASAAELDKLRKRTRAAMERAGLTLVSGRYGQTLSGPWLALLSSLPEDRHRLGLSALARYASARRIPPHRIDDRIMDAFLEALTADGLLKDVRATHKLACKFWNLASRQSAKRPMRTVVVPDYRDIYRLPWSAFPASLREDVERYLAGLADRDPMTEMTCGPVRALGVARTRSLLHSFASAFVRGGGDAGRLLGLSALVCIGAVRTALGFLLERSGGCITVQTGHFALAASSVARHWVKVDKASQAELIRLCKRVTPDSRGLSVKVKSLLSQFDDRSSVSEVLAVPARLMQKARSQGTSLAAVARTVQTALAIEILSVAPIRIGELCSLDLVRDVQLSASGRARVRLVRRGHRSEDIVELRLPSETRRLLAQYARKHRPNLCGPECTALFPGRTGGHKSDQAISHQIVQAISKETGLAMSPGLFRHFAAKHYLDRHPGGFQVVRFALGHKSLQTTTDKYSELDGAAAFRMADRYLLKPGRGKHAELPASNKISRPFRCVAVR